MHTCNLGYRGEVNDPVIVSYPRVTGWTRLSPFMQEGIPRKLGLGYKDGVNPRPAAKVTSLHSDGVPKEA